MWKSYQHPFFRLDGGFRHFCFSSYFSFFLSSFSLIFSVKTVILDIFDNYTLHFRLVLLKKKKSQSFSSAIFCENYLLFISLLEELHNVLCESVGAIYHW